MPATSPTKLIFTLARAAGKAAMSNIRGAGWSAEYQQWPERAAVCARCPLQVTKCGKSYCGQPLLRRVVRDPAVDGCGCPTIAKAKDPTEHCPITPRHEPADMHSENRIGCECKWCDAARRPQILPAAA